MSSRRRLAVVILCAAFAACGGSSPSPAAPAAVPQTSTPSQYLDQIVSIMEQNSVNRQSINWTDFGTQVHAAAPNAQAIADTYPAIRVALGLLADHHSFYMKPDGSIGVLNPSSPTGCAISPVPDAAVPADIGYVRVGSYDGVSNDARAIAFATAIQESIRGQDKDGLSGWVVDLRSNGGGNMYPMLAGVGPILGYGTAGFFIAPAYTTEFGYRPNGAYAGSSVQTPVSGEYVLRSPNPRVAVLTDKLVASSGEAIAVAFRERPNTRTFGTETCGLASGNSGFPLSDGAQVWLTTSHDADRTRHAYDGPLSPDETIAGADGLVARAIAWLRAGG